MNNWKLKKDHLQIYNSYKNKREILSYTFWGDSFS